MSSSTHYGKYPGPKLWAAYELPWGFAWKSGKLHPRLMQLRQIWPPWSVLVRTSCPTVFQKHGRTFSAAINLDNERRTVNRHGMYCIPERKDIVGLTLGDHGRMRRLSYNGLWYVATV